MKGKNVLTTGDVAKICNVAPRTVSKWFDTGQLKGYRIPGSKDRRIPMDELVRFMKSHNMPTEGLWSGKTRILIVDNNKESVQRLAGILQMSGNYEVKSVYTSFETGLVAQKFAPHVIFFNLNAKGIDTRAICETIRSDEDLQAVKIIVITGMLSDSEYTALRMKGFDDYVADLSDAEEIVRKIEHSTAVVY